MLIDELSYEKREDIKLLCQKLFNENYIPEYIFAANEKLRKANPDYFMLLACFDAVSEILDSCGWSLNRDDQVGVIYISSSYPAMKTILSKLESYFLFALRLIYDQKKTGVSATGQVFIYVRDLIEQLSSLGALDQVTKQERKKALQMLKNKNIIARITGELSDLDAKIAILPSILCVLSASKVAMLKKSLDTIQSAEEEDDDDSI